MIYLFFSMSAVPAAINPFVLSISHISLCNLKNYFYLMVKQNYQTPLLQYPIQPMPPYLSCVKHYFAIYLVLYLCLSVSTLWLTIIILLYYLTLKKKNER